MLSKEQQKVIENSIWVVNTALKKQGLQSDKDLRQSAILYMCKCLERFEPDKNIKWTTYAYKSVSLYIKKTHSKDVKKNSIYVNDDITSLNLPMETPNMFDEAKHIINNLKAHCTPEECKIIELKLQGYKIVEISSLMQCSVRKISSSIKSIKEKAKEMEI